MLFVPVFLLFVIDYEAKGDIIIKIARNQNWNVVRQMLDKFVGDINVTNFEGGSIIIYLARDQQWNIVQKVLSIDNIDVDGRDPRNGRTALMYAAEYNELDIVKTLITRKANVNAVDNNGTTALHYASGDETIAFLRAQVERTNIIK